MMVNPLPRRGSPCIRKGRAPGAFAARFSDSGGTQLRFEVTADADIASFCGLCGGFRHYRTCKVSAHNFRHDFTQKVADFLP